jgi:oligopeptide/dipeptide ABC transporter ATP-binding protein
VSALLEVENLRVRFRSMGTVRAMVGGVADPFLDAVCDVSFRIEEGEALGLVGESGSGKSTIARTIMGLVPIHGGSIRFQGKELTGLSQREHKAIRREMTLIFQDPVGSLSPRLTVRSLVTEPLRIHGYKGKDLDAEAGRLLKMVGLKPEFGRRFPHQLSGGQARRVGVARALALEPKLIIADEPTAGLDVSVQGEVLNVLARLQDELGLTILMITHNLSVVRHVTDRTAIMYLGRFVEIGPTEDVFRHPHHPYTEALLAATPAADPDAAARRIELRGELPSLMYRPSGCEFHTRCIYAQKACRSVPPKPQDLGDAQRFTCHFPLNTEAYRVGMRGATGAK